MTTNSSASSIHLGYYLQAHKKAPPTYTFMHEGPPHSRFFYATGTLDSGESATSSGHPSKKLCKHDIAAQLIIILSKDSTIQVRGQVVPKRSLKVTVSAGKFDRMCFSELPFEDHSPDGDAERWVKTKAYIEFILATLRGSSKSCKCAPCEGWSQSCFGPSYPNFFIQPYLAFIILL